MKESFKNELLEHLEARRAEIHEAQIKNTELLGRLIVDMVEKHIEKNNSKK